MRRILFGLAAIALLAVSAPARAGTWAEVGDAGESVATAQITIGSGSLDSIKGHLFAFTDMYCIRILHDGTAFSATTEPNTLAQSQGGTLDPMLMLFDKNGVGIVGNDDISNGGNGPFNNNSTITATLNAGTYLLAISGYHRTAFDSSNAEIFPGMTGPGLFPGTGATLDHFANNIDQGNTTGAYQIDLHGASFCVTPEPATLTMMGLGGLSMLGYGWKRRKVSVV